MTTPARIVRLIGILGLVGWLGMVGWVAKTSQAQNGARGVPPAPSAPAERGAVKEESAPPLPAAPNAEERASREADSSAPAAHRISAASAPPPPPIDPLPLPSEKGPSGPEPIAQAGSVAAVEGQASGAEDPEQSAQSFVERSQKEAEGHLKTLTAEADQLRSRLAKLDAGIKKWQTVLTALKGAQQDQPLTVVGEEPTTLEPVAPVPGTTAARSDKRVKWASSPAGTAPSDAPATANPGPAPAAPAGQPAAPPAQIAAPTAPSR